jgi:hypothetical protein
MYSRIICAVRSHTYTGNEETIRQENKTKKQTANTSVAFWFSRTYLATFCNYNSSIGPQNGFIDNKNYRQYKYYKIYNCFRKEVLHVYVVVSSLALCDLDIIENSTEKLMEGCHPRLLLSSFLEVMWDREFRTVQLKRQNSKPRTI